MEDVVVIAGKWVRTALGDLGIFGFMWLVTFITVVPFSWSGVATSAIVAAAVVLVTLLVQFVYYRIRKDGTKAR